MSKIYHIGEDNFNPNSFHVQYILNQEDRHDQGFLLILEDDIRIIPGEGSEMIERDPMAPYPLHRQYTSYKYSDAVRGMMDGRNQILIGGRDGRMERDAGNEYPDTDYEVLLNIRDIFILVKRIRSSRNITYLIRDLNETILANFAYPYV